MEANSRVWKLIARKISGELDRMETEELDRLLAADPELAAKVLAMQQATVSTSGAIPADRKEQMLQHILHQQQPAEIPPTPVRKLHQRWYWAAAIFLGLIVAGSLYFFQSQQRVNWSIVQAKPGTRSNVVLPDGTTVTLNAGSELAYPTDFMNSNRQVKLTGEGYFQVAKNADRPFIIHTATVDVKVLGTVFNLRAYPNESKTETALISGAVEVTIHRQKDNKILLKPGEKVEVDNQLTTVTTTRSGTPATATAATHTKPDIRIGPLVKDPVDQQVQETAWLEYKLIFREETFEQLAAQIERAYNVKIIFQDDAIKMASFSGKVKDESVTELLNILQATKHFNYKTVAGQIIIY
ncbi:FecR family protein [Chitinophaga arvensicola]|uniref:Ferric-dicitrate binding protein FerR, regulates iron transport through sigma-19 n=1 Tax=Chitinophaga arvensicola TaxID=29529 RepID=A0A1I0RIX0_9BACT|nr:FecR family protein [Chitinophaga arvensicola]SEW40209.1 ferric-dicitrate binding protein FerR, regulates iron transport through sigma-19 [Chitinophaga arvensicola]